MRLSVSLEFAAAGEDSAAQDLTAAESPAAARMDAAAFQVFYAKTAPGLRGISDAPRETKRSPTIFFRSLTCAFCAPIFFNSKTPNSKTPSSETRVSTT